ncbi:mitochondrial 37S ribosomal protein [Starmerella bacillaris]|uniref:Small ribosomal subunit protein uS5m n=1 Tax=Starmerella bacillaris TaxID=1247836 RepID=A0AAV5RKP8_STABA|nr:mitochondrial 37S ribosomal protein [Starmerella bacillaris]
MNRVLRLNKISRVTFARCYSTKGSGSPGNQSANHSARSQKASNFGPTDTINSAHIESLSKYYPPHLLKAIAATESVITPEMKANPTRSSDNFMLPYADDLAEFDPLYDYPQGEWVDKHRPQQPIPQRAPKDLREQEDIMSSRSSMAINLTNLEKSTGLRKEFLAKLSVKTLLTKRVVNMEASGKKRRIFALVIVGDGNGHVGIGQGKSRDYASAVKNAHWEAAKSIVYIPRFKNRTIYGSVSLKKGSVHLHLNSARPGSGLRVNHIIYEICKIAGIKDLVGNVFGSRNKMNVAKTAIQALSSGQAVIEDIAASRGKQIVDVTSTYLNF